MDFFLCELKCIYSTSAEIANNFTFMKWKKSKVKITLLYCVWDEGGKKDGRMKKCWITIRKVSLFMYVVQLYHSNFFLLLSDFVASIVTATVILHTSWRIRISRKEFSRHEIFSFYFFDRVGKSKKKYKKNFHANYTQWSSSWPSGRKFFESFYCRHNFCNFHSR